MRLGGIRGKWLVNCKKWKRKNNWVLEKIFLRFPFRESEREKERAPGRWTGRDGSCDDPNRSGWWVSYKIIIRLPRNKGDPFCRLETCQTCVCVYNGSILKWINNLYPRSCPLMFLNPNPRDFFIFIFWSFVPQSPWINFRIISTNVL